MQSHDQRFSEDIDSHIQPLIGRTCMNERPNTTLHEDIIPVKLDNFSIFLKNFIYGSVIILILYLVFAFFPTNIGEIDANFPLKNSFCPRESNITERGYKCTGPSYETFYKHLQKHLSEMSYTGPIPSNYSIVFLGNSHTRQILNAFTCQLNDFLKEEVFKRVADKHGSGVKIFKYRKGIRIYSAINTWELYRSDWRRVLETSFGVKLRDVDLIILGMFNSWEDRFRDVNGDLSSGPPRVEDFRDLSTKILLCQMFDSYADGNWRADKRQAAKFLKNHDTLYATVGNTSGNLGNAAHSTGEKGHVRDQMGTIVTVASPVMRT